MVDLIKYENKVALQNDPTIPDRNKVTADNMNEIKQVINKNANRLEEVSNIDDKIDEYLTRQDELERKYDEQIKNIAATEPQNAEIVDARNGYQTLGQVINKKIYKFNNVSEMKLSPNLKQGDVVQTLGYYEPDDGGGALYQIMFSSLQYDGYFTQMLESGLYANIIIQNNQVSIKQLGARPQDRLGNKYDIKEYIDAYISRLDTLLYKMKLYIPSGIWHSSGTEIVRTAGFEIYGDEQFSMDRANGTIITSLNDEQEYILNIGDSTKYTKQWVFKNIVISSAEFIYNESIDSFVYGNLKRVNSALNLHYATFGISDNLFFSHIKGQAFSINSCWEDYFGLLNFRSISNHDGAIWRFETVDTTLLTGPNVSACEFEKVMFEAVHGHLILLEKTCGLGNCHFGTINFEDYKFVVDNEEYTTFDDTILETFDDLDAIHSSMFYFEDEGRMNSVVIDSIELNNVSYRYYEREGKTYVYDTIFNLNNKSFIACNVNNIAIAGMNKDMRIVKQDENVLSDIKSTVNIGQIINRSNKNFYFDVHGFTNIECVGNLKSHLFNKDYLGSGITAFCDIAEIHLSGNKGMLYYDKEALNKKNLCIKPFLKDSRIFAEAVVGGRNILIRAKVKNRETFIITLINKVTMKTANLSMQGTGNFEDYTFELPTNVNVGELRRFVVSSSNTGTECLLDYYKFY